MRGREREVEGADVGPLRVHHLGEDQGQRPAMRGREREVEGADVGPLRVHTISAMRGREDLTRESGPLLQSSYIRETFNFRPSLRLRRLTTKQNRNSKPYPDHNPKSNPRI